MEKCFSFVFLPQIGDAPFVLAGFVKIKYKIMDCRERRGMVGGVGGRCSEACNNKQPHWSSIINREAHWSLSFITLWTNMIQCGAKSISINNFQLLLQLLKLLLLLLLLLLFLLLLLLSTTLLASYTNTPTTTIKSKTNTNTNYNSIAICYHYTIATAYSITAASGLAALASANTISATITTTFPLSALL